MKCETIISFHSWTTTERRRGFQPPWYTVYVYRCPDCNTPHYIHQNWHGGMPLGAFVCNTEVPK